jgi:hypothetical protein
VGYQRDITLIGSNRLADATAHRRQPNDRTQ